jgi:hypothetical protein
VLPFPDASATVGPAPSSNPYAATSPGGSVPLPVTVTVRVAGLLDAPPLSVTVSEAV